MNAYSSYKKGVLLGAGLATLVAALALLSGFYAAGTSRLIGLIGLSVRHGHSIIHG